PATPISASTRIASGPPVFSSCIEEKSASGLRVRTVGFSPTRELKQALFRFTATAGSDLKTTDLSVPDAGVRLFTPFYSGLSGLTSFNFRYVQTFKIDGDPNALSTVSVILENAKGQSAPVLAAGVCAGQ
ncbi:MAG TPA: hypothetical protein VKE70_34615, partial [Candidatus Solibacter sp.]|nr:hypothetical protein [Candidatus Solibacter sp.]